MENVVSVLLYCHIYVITLNDSEEEEEGEMDVDDEVEEEGKEDDINEESESQDGKVEKEEISDLDRTIQDIQNVKLNDSQTTD